MKKYECTPSKILYSGIATIVFWKDGTKTVVKRAEGTKADNYNAFCAALAKKVYGTNSMTKKIIKRAENGNGNRANGEIRIGDRANGEIRIGDRVMILDGNNIPDYTASWVEGMKRYVGKIGTVKEIIDYFGREGVRLKEFGFTYDMRGLKKV